MSNIKSIIFDLDGTLCGLVEVHYQSLNKAILEIAGEEFIINKHEQDTIYNGLSTKTKLTMLSKSKNLDYKLINPICDLKQKLTIKEIESIIYEDINLRNCLLKLKSEGYLLSCASNAMINTVTTALAKLNILDLFDDLIGNDKISKQKPNSEIYLQAFIRLGLNPKECLIVEDSKHGREAGLHSGANVCTLKNEKELTYDYIKSTICKYEESFKTLKWKDTRLKVLIPMAGLGSRFAKDGFKLPKPLIDVNNQPMIKHVFDNLNVDAEYIFLVQKKHYEDYNLKTMLSLMAPNCKIILTDGIIRGAAYDCLLAEEYIDNDCQLLIANSDQFVEWNSWDFFNHTLNENIDALILTFQNSDPKYSYVKLDDKNNVSEVREKEVISNTATVGIYFYSKGSDFVKYAKQMIDKNIRVNNEFYVAPVFNEMIADGKIIKTFDCKKMWSLGTPEDLHHFLKNYNT